MVDTMNFRVIHQTLGRIRISVPRLRDDAAYAEQLTKLIQSLSFVTSIRVNPAAQSIIVHYDPSKSDQEVLAGITTCYQQITPVETSVDLTPQPSASQPAKQHAESEGELIARTSGEVIGEAIGEAIGELLLGPPGAVIGATVMEKVCESLAESIEEKIVSKADSTKNTW